MSWKPGGTGPLEDDEIEMTDIPLREDAAEERPVRTHTPRISLRSRRTPLERRRILIRSGIVVMVALVVLLAITPSVRQAALNTLFPSSAPAPTPSKPLAGPGLLYLHTFPTWGTMSIDGQQLRVPTASDAIPGMAPPLRLKPGVHRIEWRAEPFLPQQCLLVIPPATGSSTCQLSRALPNKYTEEASLLTLPISLDALPVVQQAALAQQMQSLLDTLQSSDTVQPGEHYIIGLDTPQVQIAREPLSATLRFHLETSTSAPALCSGISLGNSCSIARQDCRRLCTLQWVGSGLGWDVAAILRPEWTYTGHGQQPVQGPDTTMQGGNLQFVTFHISWQSNHWRVTFHPDGQSSFDNPACISTISEIVTNPATDSSRNPNFTWEFASGPHSAAGCLGATIVQRPDVPDQQGTTLVQGLVLHRFGVMLAANRLAHKLWPDFPVATPQEVAIAQQIQLK